MSINDVPEIRQLFKGFVIETVATTYSVAGANKKKKVNELLIMNYTPARYVMSIGLGNIISATVMRRRLNIMIENTCRC
jgi:hypothetical protein